MTVPVKTRRPARTTLRDPAAADLQRWASGLAGTIRRERTRRGLTQAELGLNMGISQTAVGHLERDVERCKLGRLYLALRLLGLELVVCERAERKAPSLPPSER